MEVWTIEFSGFQERVISVGSILRSHPHTPGRYTPDVSPSVYEGILCFLGGERGSLGYLPRVCGTK